jgi:hypothetical protein
VAAPVRFDDLDEGGRARRLRPLALSALRACEHVRAWPDDDLVRACTAGAALTFANAAYRDSDPDYRREAARYAVR